MRRKSTKVLAVAAVCLSVPFTAFAQSSSSGSGTGSGTGSGSGATGTGSTDVQQRPVMLSDTASFTDVIDAADPGSTWSFRAILGFETTTRRGTLQREAITEMVGALCPGSATQRLQATGQVEYCNLATYGQTTHTFLAGVELAVFHDLSVHLHLPVILADQRSWDTHPDVSTPAAALLDGYSLSGTPTNLFSLPFRSPDRAGIDQLRIGISWNILNNQRDHSLPTWLLRFEYRPPVGALLSPCVIEGGQTVCPAVLAQETGGPLRSPMTAPSWTPADSTNVNASQAEYDRPRTSPADPGISRGVHTFYLLTAFSRRFGFVEPYIGLDAQFDLPQRNTFFRFGERPFGQLSDFPPVTGSVIAGVEIVPWENRETWQRFTIDARVRGQYWSQGRDFSPLYDALGASNSLPLTLPSYAIRDYENRARPIYFTGTTGIQSRSAVTIGTTLGIQPARFLRFTFGGSMTFTVPYSLTQTDPCNPNETPANQAERGGCVGNAVPDPLHRPVIDSPGERFRFINDFNYTINLNVIVTPRLY